MIRKILAAIVVISMCGTSVTGTGSGINAMVEEFKSETGCSGVSVVVSDHGEMSYYGDMSCLYQIGSMTKSFTGLAIERLISEGELSEDDTVSDLIPGFSAYYNSSPVDITIGNLLSQQSGYTNSETDYPSADNESSLAEWAATISGRELKCMPGTEYAYSNVNYNLLGLIIENTTGRSYREYMEEEMLFPMGLDSTTAGMPANSEFIMNGSRIGFRHAFDYDIPVREGAVPAGYFYSNAEDIGIWMNAWINGSDPCMSDVFSRLVDKGDYYAGWERFDGDVIGHSGGTPNYSSRIVFSVSEEVGVCVLTNLNVAASTDSLCNNIFAELTGREHGKLECDVWTVFDIIFTSVSLAGTATLVLIFFIKKKGVLIGAGAGITLLLALILILFPVIFGAGLSDIALIWAPWSFAAVLAVLAADIAGVVIRYCVVKVNEGRKATG